eukprot:4866130-Amphidinium_carterae.3
MALSNRFKSDTVIRFRRRVLDSMKFRNDCKRMLKNRGSGAHQTIGDARQSHAVAKSGGPTPHVC